jgi:gliding motility-associated lipoprotein GldD
MLPVAACLLLLFSCAENTVPKPRGYFRIDLPPDSVVPFSGHCPFTAEVPAYARMAKGMGTGEEDGNACWTDMIFPGQRGVVYITWRQVQGDLPELINDAHEFKAKHEVLATRIRTEEVRRDSARVFGTLFAVDGNVASPMVFYLTDSSSNFLYGALYFDTRPNADSLAPVTDRIRQDILRFANTLRWKDASGAVQHVQQRHQ